jgi:hypothetical protein
VPQTLHAIVQKALIERRSLSAGVIAGLHRDQRGRCHLVHENIRHQLDIQQNIVDSREHPISLHLGDQCLSSRLLTEDHITNNNVDRKNNSLGLSSRTDQGSRPVGRQLLLQVPRVLDRRKGVGHVGNHITNATAQWRGPEHLDQSDPLPWDIWARPIGFMQQ